MTNFVRQGYTFLGVKLLLMTNYGVNFVLVFDPCC